MAARLESANDSETQIDLAALYAEITTALEMAERRAAELRGQKQLLERLISMARRPSATNGHTNAGDLE